MGFVFRIYLGLMLVLGVLQLKDSLRQVLELNSIAIKISEGTQGHRDLIQLSSFR